MELCDWQDHATLERHRACSRLLGVRGAPCQPPQGSSTCKDGADNDRGPLLVSECETGSQPQASPHVEPCGGWRGTPCTPRSLLQTLLSGSKPLRPFKAARSWQSRRSIPPHPLTGQSTGLTGWGVVMPQFKNHCSTGLLGVNPTEFNGAYF